MQRVHLNDNIDNDETGRPRFGTRTLLCEKDLFQHNAWYVSAPRVCSGMCIRDAQFDVLITLNMSRLTYKKINRQYN